MRHDHRPYWLKRLALGIEAFYAEQWLRPQFDGWGRGHTLMQPWYVDITGPAISVGDHLHLIARSDRRVSFCVWAWQDEAGNEHHGAINLADNVLVCPGVRIDSASRVEIGDGTMLAAGSYVSDADWHDLHDRSRPIGATQPVVLGPDVWLGDGAMVCKGVTIGAGTVVGARSVVTHDLPPGVIAAGNPARVIRELDGPVTGRSALFADPVALARRTRDIDRYVLHHNTLAGWLRSWLFRKNTD